MVANNLGPDNLHINAFRDVLPVKFFFGPVTIGPDQGETFCEIIAVFSYISSSQIH